MAGYRILHLELVTKQELQRKESGNLKNLFILKINWFKYFIFKIFILLSSFWIETCRLSAKAFILFAWYICRYWKHNYLPVEIVNLLWNKTKRHNPIFSLYYAHSFSFISIYKCTTVSFINHLRIMALHNYLFSLICMNCNNFLGNIVGMLPVSFTRYSFVLRFSFF